MIQILKHIGQIAGDQNLKNIIKMVIIFKTLNRNIASTCSSIPNLHNEKAIENDIGNANLQNDHEHANMESDHGELVIMFLKMLSNDFDGQYQ